MAKSGAHILKLQTYTADTLTIQSNKDDFVIKDKTAFGVAEHYMIYIMTLIYWDYTQNYEKSK